MAFPSTFTIRYYRGDTYEFKIYPKDASGNAFPLTGYDLTEGVIFTISTQRGEAGFPDAFEAYSKISDDRTHINCAILPANGAVMQAGLNYVYDIEINKAAVVNVDPYPTVITLLTGNISVTEEVTPPVPEEELS
jgi:hypothetical protein